MEKPRLKEGQQKLKDAALFLNALAKNYLSCCVLDLNARYYLSNGRAG